MKTTGTLGISFKTSPGCRLGSHLEQKGRAVGNKIENGSHGEYPRKEK